MGEVVGFSRGTAAQTVESVSLHLVIHKEYVLTFVVVKNGGFVGGWDEKVGNTT